MADLKLNEGPYRCRGPLTRFALHVLFLSAALGQSAMAQTDGNVFVPPSSDPEKLIVAGDRLLFVADDGAHGRELWKFNAESQEAELIRDITPGREQTVFGELVALGDVCLFSVRTREFGNELWRSDGTADGTYRLKRWNYGPDKGFQYFLDAIDGVYFLAVAEIFATRLWRSDGTPDGTVPVFDDANANVPTMQQNTSAALPNAVLFSASTMNDQQEGVLPGLWRTDGTPGGTYRVASFWVSPTEFFEADGRVLFQGAQEDTGNELWISDGSAEGTYLLHDISPGPSSSSPRGGQKTETGVCFAAWREDVGQELWHSDLEGELTLLEIEPGVHQSDPYKFVHAQDRVYFAASDSAHGNELWRTFGTKETTVRLTDSRPGPAGGEPYAFCPFEHRLFFSAHSDEYGEELWISEGDPDTTRLVLDIAEGPMSSSPYGTVFYHEHAYFAATHPLYGRELWRSNGKPEGTALVADINDDLSINPSSAPQQLTAAGDLLFFVADDIQHGAELWCSDGTASGTYMVRDIYPGRPSSDPQELTAVGDILYFRADDGSHGVELWRSNGTESGTALVFDIEQRVSSGPHEITAYKGKAVFVARRDFDGEELWITQQDGARLVKDIAPGPPSSSPRDITVWNGRIYFRADDGVHGEELWTSDGTSQGTYMVKDIVPIPFEGASVQELAPLGRRIFFAADDRVRGLELWTLFENDGNVVSVIDLVTADAILERPAARAGRP